MQVKMTESNTAPGVDERAGLAHVSAAHVRQKLRELNQEANITSISDIA